MDTRFPLVLHDTQRREKAAFEPITPGEVGVYCCGPTVYDLSHIGHARAALAPDLLVRFLRLTGQKVTYVRNITDVDDKIIRRAQEQGETPEAIATRFSEAYLEDMDALGMLRPDIQPKVTEHIAEIIALIERIIEAEKAYVVDGDVYFDVQAFEGYGQLSGRKLDDMKAGARVEVDTRKRSPADFALWKAVKPGEPSWESPWGLGRPGWHIECSAMSERHLGSRFDIHAGGRDLIFPHHENERAQSQAVCGPDCFAQHWMHNGFVNFAGEKMAKSVGNFFTIREIHALYQPEVLRYFLMTVHYRGPINFEVEIRCRHCGAELSKAAQEAGHCEGCEASLSRTDLRAGTRFLGLEEADERVATIYDSLEQAEAFLETAKAAPEGTEALPAIQALKPGLLKAMADDLNTAEAMGVLSQALSELNRLLDSKKAAPKPVRQRSMALFVEGMRFASELLGVFGEKPAAYLQKRRDLKAGRIGLDVAKVEALMAAREAARAAKDWGEADRLRDALTALGVKLRDGRDGTRWVV